MSQINLPHPNNNSFGNISVMTGSVTTGYPVYSYGTTSFPVSLGAGAGGAAGAACTTYATSATTSWTPDMKVSGVVSAKDFQIDGVSLKDTLKSIQGRLAILVPDPEKLEKFEALKKCYEEYQLLEKLCQLETPKDNT